MEKSCSTCCDYVPPKSCKSFPKADKSPSGRCYLWSDTERQMKDAFNMDRLFGQTITIPPLKADVSESIIDAVRNSDNAIQDAIGGVLSNSSFNNVFPLPVPSVPNYHIAPVNMIEPHETWNIIDSTKLETFKECPRMFFYKYVLGWEPEFTSHDLVFGQAWHIAMEYLLLHGYGMEQVINAHELFATHYERHFPIEVQGDLEPKSSAGALLALTHYAARYGAEDSLLRVHYTEIAGTISVLKGRILHFRMDTVAEDQQHGVFSLEHKTTKTLERTFVDKWSLHNQPNLYTHVLYCLFPTDSVYGVIINGTALYKQGPRTKKPPAEFKRVPCRRTPEMMNVWIHNLDRWLDDLYDEYNRLMSTEDSADFMSAFKQNDASCTHYWGCQYHDFCIGWANPVQYCNDVPSGFVKRYWDPSNPEDSPAPKYEFHDGKLIKKEVDNG